MTKTKLLFLTSIVLWLGLFSCEKIDLNDNLYSPSFITSIIGDSEVQLEWASDDGFLLTETMVAIQREKPDKFEIHLSEDLKSFTKVVELDNSVTQYTISNLVNGQSYYAHIISRKKGFAPKQSQTIMFVPNRKTQLEKLIESGEQQSVLQGSYSSETNKLAFVDVFHKWTEGGKEYGQIAIMISKLDGSQSVLFGKNFSEPQWSSSGRYLVFRTERSVPITSRIAFYDALTQDTTIVTDGTTECLYPVFSPDESKILYRSRSNTDANRSSIIMYDVATKTSKTIISTQNTSLTNIWRFSWIDNSTFLFSANELDADGTNIYKATTSNGAFEKIFGSQWADFCPVISPDKNNIAFISNRSGLHQIWVYNIARKSFRQITGFDKTDYISEVWSNIQWLDDKNIMFSINYDKLVKQKID
ncbi:MAG: translocation protein TolB [Bacteroidetes bacterium ADurb.BinA174]|nr:MAG: translocation protein TolB [Bacteroidetes bacterium ADurb.BinA174]